MVSLHKKNKGFTIVELVIVIVVIGILATLVIVTFTGMKQKGRNVQRQTDIKAVNSYVESFYAEYGFYPAAADLNDPTFRKDFLKGLDPKALSDPNQPGDTGAIKATKPATGEFVYGYVTSKDDGTACGTTTTVDSTTDPNNPVPTDNGCTKYTLTANLEGSGNKTYTKESN